MKNYKILTLFLLISLVLTSCGEDLSVGTMDTNHRVIVTSEMNFENRVSVNGHIDFGDISRGVVSRLWTLPGDTDVAVIAKNGASTSSDDVIKGIFYKPGVYDVTLNQTFGGDVYPNEDSTEPINSRELDTTIVVTVLDSLRADLKLYYINDDGTTGAELVLADGAENELTASKSVRLTFTSVGEEDNVTWSSEGGKPSSETTTLNEFDMRFNTLGSWDLDFRAFRDRPRDADTLSFEKLIKVIPSTDPVTLDRVFGVDGKIGLEFSRDIDPESVDPSTFSVRIENDGSIFMPMVSTATINADEANIVILELDNETVYNDDQVFVSYTPGTLRTSDLVDATEIINAELSGFRLVNIYESTDFDYSFENSTIDDWPNHGWGGIWGQFNHEISSNVVRTGSNSLYIEFEPNGGMIMRHENTVPIESGKEYEIGYWMYIVDGIANAPSGDASSDIRIYEVGFGIADLIPTVFSSSLPTGEWIYQSFQFKSVFGGDATLLIRGFNENNPDTLKFYLDDMSLSEIRLRP